MHTTITIKMNEDNILKEMLTMASSGVQISADSGDVFFANVSTDACALRSMVSSCARSRLGDMPCVCMHMSGEECALEAKQLITDVHDNNQHGTYKHIYR